MPEEILNVKPVEPNGSGPIVSVIVPTQGTRASLAAALRSALAQNCPALEIVVVDDAVAERDWPRRPDLAEALADPRVRVVAFNEGRGCAAAKNAGLRAARGKWVCYLDDDNRYLADKVEAQRALAERTDSALVVCGMEVEAGGRRRVKQVEAERFAGEGLLLDLLPDTNVLFHRREGAPWWDEELGTADDACHAQALIATFGLTEVPSVPRPLVVYRAHREARANRGGDRHYRGQRRFLVRWARRYSKKARRVMTARIQLATQRFDGGTWSGWWRWSWRLLAVGGIREWRLVANTAAARLPLVRRWIVS